VSTVSPSFEQLLATVFASPAISVYGFYGHAGNAYGSTNPSEAVSFLVSEIEAVNTAAGLALAFLSKSPHLGIRSQPFVLSVGSTPTAHAATSESKVLLSSLLNGTLELHAGRHLIIGGPPPC
jgi:D-serine deaminase-like pyridoxal phosphate-dependent protein